MRKIKTCILRLVTNTGEFPALHGTVQDVGEEKGHVFTDEQTLLGLLRRLCRAETHSTGDLEEEE